VSVCLCIYIAGSRDSSDGIATRYGLDGPGIESRWGDQRFCTRPDRLCGPPSLLHQCFSTAGPRPGTGPWHQLCRAARGSPGICHFSFLSLFHESIFYIGNILRRIMFVNVSKSSDPERLNNICVANVSN